MTPDSPAPVPPGGEPPDTIPYVPGEDREVTIWRAGFAAGRAAAHPDPPDMTNMCEGESPDHKPGITPAASPDERLREALRVNALLSEQLEEARRWHLTAVNEKRAAQADAERLFTALDGYIMARITGTDLRDYDDLAERAARAHRALVTDVPGNLDRTVLDPETGIEEPVTTGRIPDAEFVEPPLMPPAASPDERLTREAVEALPRWIAVEQAAGYDPGVNGPGPVMHSAVLLDDVLDLLAAPSHRGDEAAAGTPAAVLNTEPSPGAASPDERLREALALIAQHARLDLTERSIAEAERYAVIAEDALAAADREAPDEPRGEKITHGRHCICTACAVEDWTNPAYVCGMHGKDCPREYQPLGPAGSFVPPRDEVKETISSSRCLEAANPERKRRERTP